MRSDCWTRASSVKCQVDAICFVQSGILSFVPIDWLLFSRDGCQVVFSYWIFARMRIIQFQFLSTLHLTLYTINKKLYFPKIGWQFLGYFPKKVDILPKLVVTFLKWLTVRVDFYSCYLLGIYSVSTRKFRPSFSFTLSHYHIKKCVEGENQEFRGSGV